MPIRSNKFAVKKGCISDNKEDLVDHNVLLCAPKSFEKGTCTDSHDKSEGKKCKKEALFLHDFGEIRKNVQFYWNVDSRRSLLD